VMMKRTPTQRKGRPKAGEASLRSEVMQPLELI
jgi:hypothetical protein